MNKKSFIKWYISDGVSEFFGIWKRLVLFIPRYFSIVLLLRTLLSPWHKDVSAKNWRGFSLVRSSERILWNIFSRIIGAVVRLCVIAVAIMIWSITVVVGGIIVSIYITLPALWIVTFVFFFTTYWQIAVAFFVLSVMITLFAYRIYKISGHKSYHKMDIMELNNQKWFYRVYERIGVSKENIPASILKDFEEFKKFLIQKNITIEEFEKIVAWEIDKQKKREEDARIFSAKKFLKKRPIGLSWHFGYTVNLDKYAQDLTKFNTSNIAFDAFHGFEREMDLINVVLSRPSENSVILTGEPGTGRHMIVEELSRRIRNGYFENSFMKYMRVLKCDFSGIMAQVRSEGGDAELVINNLFHEAAHAGNVILVVDNFKNYMNTNESHGFSFTTIIDQYASLETFRMIAITTEENFYTDVNNNQILMRHFDVVDIEEMDDEHAMRVLFSRFYGKDHTPFTYQALRQILIDSSKYTNTSPLPSRAIDLAMEVFINWQSNGSGFIVAQTVDEFITKKTGVPVGKIDAEESDKLLSLEDSFHKYIVGQEYAVRNVASAVRRMRSGMASPNKPAGSFLFLGPTGVGKTEMAKVLADQYFGSRKKVIRLDMSEFQGDSALDRLIGSRALNQQGILTTAARENPYALLLLDEVEKANPRVLDIFLQVLDEGFLHDAFGRKVNFTTMIIIATSNAAAITIKKMIENGIKDDKMKKKVIDVVINSGEFRPEFLNRFDDVVIFHPLGDDHVVRVGKMLLDKFAARMDEEQHITVTFDDEVLQNIIEKGFDPIFGARSLIHYIDETVADALAKKLITGNINRGETLNFTVDDLDD
ncbi:MAG: AAA family ATPase [Candidatus Moraniibacteriota bacterium]|jgi:ATP-dependent Clp protease ATP-binding subunit ClpC